MHISCYYLFSLGSKVRRVVRTRRLQQRQQAHSRCLRMFGPPPPDSISAMISQNDHPWKGWRKQRPGFCIPQAGLCTAPLSGPQFP